MFGPRQPKNKLTNERKKKLNKEKQSYKGPFIMLNPPKPKYKQTSKSTEHYNWEAIRKQLQNNRLAQQNPVTNNKSTNQHKSRTHVYTRNNTRVQAVKYQKAMDAISNILNCGELEMLRQYIIDRRLNLLCKKRATNIMF